jgi:general secretion pathway protein M
MKAWWLQLNTREQQLISALGSVLIVFLLFSFIWQPLNENIDKAQKKLVRQQSLLTWVKTETQRYKATKGNGSNSRSSGSLSSIVNRTAGANAIAITRMQPQGNDLQVWIDNIAFSQLLQWLERLSTQEGISVKAIDLTRGEQIGQVSVRRLQLGKN